MQDSRIAIEQIAALITPEMITSGFEAWQDWAEDQESPSLFVVSVLASSLASADPGTRLALSRLLGGK